MEFVANKTKIVLKRGDITEEETDAIVNAANSHLQHGGGVAGAIVRKGGRIIQEESNRIGFVPVGEAAITGAGTLKTRYVIHAVGPRMGEGDEDEKLKNATWNSLQVAKENGIRTVSFPAISTGIFGCPIDRCARIMLGTIRSFCNDNALLEEVRFCLFDESALRVFEEASAEVFS